MSARQTKLSICEMHDNANECGDAECSRCLSCFPHLAASGEVSSGNSGSLIICLLPPHIPAHQPHHYLPITLYQPRTKKNPIFVPITFLMKGWLARNCGALVILVILARNCDPDHSHPPSPSNCEPRITPMIET